MDHVELDFHYKHTHDDDDDDVDMIPLIDVSLVLLVFFMISAGSAGMSSPVPAPEAENGLMADNPDSLRIDIKRDKDGSPLFSLALGTAPPTEDERDMISQAEVLDRLKTRLQNITTTEMVVNADKDLRAKIPRDLLTELRKEPYRSKIRVNYLGVSEKQQ
jgi:biopolymer transport protein ExbD